MTEFKKQHYIFNFRDPEFDPVLTGWDAILGKIKPKKERKETNLEDIISNGVKERPSSPKHDKLELTSKFIAVVEKLLNLN